MLKKNLYLLFIFLLLGTAFSQDYWVKTGFAPQMTLNKVTYSDTSKFYIAADSGKIFYSSDGGNNWAIQTTGLLSHIIDIEFVNVNTGFAISHEFGLNDPNFLGSIVLKTTNGGVNWINNYLIDTNVFYTRIDFINNNDGFMTGHPDGIFRTTNGGQSWAQDYIDTMYFSTFPVRTIKTIGMQFGIACGGWNDIQGVIWRTTNSGVNWLTTGVGPEPLYDLHFFNDNYFIAVGGDPEYGASLVKTTDAGANWEYITLEIYGTALAVSFRTPQDGWMGLGLGQKFLYSNDGGDNWIPIPTPNGEQIYDLRFSNHRNGIAVGRDGALLKYNTKLVNISNPDISLPGAIELKQNYPNPFNPETIISFKLAKGDYISLKVFDMLGREIRTLEEGYKKPGEYKIKFHSDDIPAGVYYYTLKTESEFSQTKKMILVK